MKVNTYIDHTLLKPEATSEQIKNLCLEAKKYDFAAVCVNAYYVPLAATELKESQVKVCTVVGFPLGASPTETKLNEAEWAINKGAKEIDMVINIGALKDKEYSIVEEDITKLVKLCHSKKAILKVIIETCLLSEEEKIKACELSEKAGADFVKTSTGFAGGGATFKDVALMRKTVTNKVKIKASGGVKSHDDALKMIELGADRIGTSSGVKLVKGEKALNQY